MSVKQIDADLLSEMLLVLGNPGAGCTSLLNILSNHRLGYAEIDGDVSFGSMSSDEAKAYRGQIGAQSFDGELLRMLT
jgi:ABC-type multidrug transport system ATPase subunit